MVLRSFFIMVVFIFHYGALNASEIKSGYKLAPEDILNISVWKEDGLQQDVIVRPDGLLTFPLAGTIQAEGRTVEDVNVDISKRIHKFIPDSVVTVSLIKVAGNKIYVIGKVTRPGEYVVGRYIDVMQALALAGGLTAYASEGNIIVIRRIDGTQKSIPFVYSDVKTGKNLDQNIILRAGDSVVVQ